MRPGSAVRLGDLGATLERRADGAMIVRSTGTVTDAPAKLTAHLDRWARAAPDRTFLAKRRNGGDWQRLSYADAASGARAIAGHLRSRDLSPERPLAILSGNDIEHALLALGAMYAGVPYAPISPAYSQLSSDFGKLRDIMARLTPGLVFVDDAARFAKAIAACCAPTIEIVAARSGVLDEPPSIDSGEITDKGSINQRAVLARRSGLVDELYNAKASSRIIGAE